MVHPLMLGTRASLIHSSLKKTALPFASFFQYLPTTLSSWYIHVNETVVIYKKQFYVTERSLTPFNTEFTIKNQYNNFSSLIMLKFKRRFLEVNV